MSHIRTREKTKLEGVSVPSCYWINNHSERKKYEIGRKEIEKFTDNDPEPDVLVINQVVCKLSKEEIWIGNKPDVYSMKIKNNGIAGSVNLLYLKIRDKKETCSFLTKKKFLELIVLQTNSELEAIIPTIPDVYDPQKDFNLKKWKEIMDYVFDKCYEHLDIGIYESFIPLLSLRKNSSELIEKKSIYNGTQRCQCSLFLLLSDLR